MNQGKVALYKPTLEDLWFREELLKDHRTMTFNHKWGGAISFPKEEWESWYNKWMNAPETQRYYRYLVNAETKEFIGEVAYHLDEEKVIHIASVIVKSDFRGYGYGSEALDLLVSEAKKNGVRVLYDTIALDNPAYFMFLRHGFQISYMDNDIVTVKREL